ncbi:helix-turn-helix domain-containing protein [Peptococcus niger]|uniref:Putative DNA-binding domain-containing protein n=1 Tax=Peptococcus niger TaxID=2741 RepID=A0A1G6TQM2_PEPNI|nr:RNA-binding domain-containing protein [Peptococcus niger]SDD31351.1 Putative DNA-binding domain-containing protein [Peptococcus niger]
MYNFDTLIKKLCSLPYETPWLEFKHNNYDPDTIGKNISALANSATWQDQQFAYLIWGVNDKTHEIIGTDVDFLSLKKGNQDLESWLRDLLSVNANFEFYSTSIYEKKIGVLVIHPAINTTVRFKKTEYIRIGSYTKPLSNYPRIQEQLWEKLQKVKFEDQIALSDLSIEDILSLLDIEPYFSLQNKRAPSKKKEILHYLIEDKIVIPQNNSLYSISNMGAILFAKNLSSFNRLSRKAVRVVQYADTSRFNMLKEDTINFGYALGFWLCTWF